MTIPKSLDITNNWLNTFTMSKPPLHKIQWPDMEPSLGVSKKINEIKPLHTGDSFDFTLWETPIIPPLPQNPPLPEMKPSSHKLSDIYDYNKLSKYVGLEGSIPIRASSMYIGLEIELEKCNFNYIPAGTWKVVEDHSLKEEGNEFVTIPIQAKYIETELQRLFAGIKTHSISPRCSVHVHLNSRDFTLEELEKFLLLYLIFERSLYRVSGDRWKNNFCVPLYTYPNIFKAFINNLKENTVSTEWYKYSGLNLLPIFGMDSNTFGTSKRYGTIEFRHMEGTTDIPRILSWINLIISLKVSAKRLKISDIYTYIETMNTTSGYYWLADYVFKRDARLITSQPTFKEDIEMCISSTKSQVIKLNKSSIELPIILKGNK